MNKYCYRNGYIGLAVSISTVLGSVVSSITVADQQRVAMTAAIFAKYNL